MYLVRIIFGLLAYTHSYALIGGTALEHTGDLVRIEFENNESVCSGFYITPYSIITAAHCFYASSDHHLLKIEKITSEQDEIKHTTIKQILHPQYYLGGWSSNDVAIIETEKNQHFEGSFILGTHEKSRFAHGVFYGTGKIDLENNILGRSSGTNSFARIFSFLFSFGRPAIAPHDSGAPVVDQESNRVIALASKTTTTMKIDQYLPTVSISTSLLTISNAEFIRANTK